MSNKASTVPCLLCRVDVEVGSDHGQYENHLRDVHGVWSNRSWLVDQTFMNQNFEEGASTSLEIQCSLTKIKVKSSSEAENISDIRVLSVNIEEAVRSKSLRRSSRKRSASRSPEEGKEAKLKATNSTIFMREPVDLMVLEVDAETSQYSSTCNLISKGSPGILKKLCGSADLDLNFCQVGPTETVRDDFAGESGSKCEKCDKIFEVSNMKFHLKKIHGMSSEDYLEFHGESTGVKMKLIRSEVVNHMVNDQEVSLKTYGGGVMKKKDVNDKETKVIKNTDVNDKEVKLMKKTDGNYIGSEVTKTMDLNDNEVTVVKMEENQNASGNEANVIDALPISLKPFRRNPGGQVQPTLGNKLDEDSVVSKEQSVVDTQNVLTEEAMETMAKDVKENDFKTKHVNYNVEEVNDKNYVNYESGDEETVPVSKASNEGDVQDDSSSVKEDKNLLLINMSPNEGNVYSDNYDDSCIVECSICDKQMPVERLRGHTSSQHHLPISKYKEQFGSQPAFVKMTFHLCKLCGKEVLLDKDSVAGHVRGSHKWSAKQYNTEYMVYRRSRMDKSLLIKNYESSPEEGSANCNQASGSSEPHWYDANTFTCNICTFSCSSLGTFKKHVKSDHKSSLAKFSPSYSKTDVWYKCQCCDREVFHERKSIQSHVEGHLLSIEQYARLYERKSIVKSEEVVEHEIVSVNLQPCQELDLLNEIVTDPLNDPLEITSINFNGDGEENPPATSFTPCARPDEVDQVSQTDGVASIPGSVSPKPSPAKKKVGSSTPTLPDIFLYMCPSPGCDFHTDYKGMMCGTAGAHGMDVHRTDLVQIKARGLKWKKVSLETRMEELFADD